MICFKRGYSIRPPYATASPILPQGAHSAVGIPIPTA